MVCAPRGPRLPASGTQRQLAPVSGAHPVQPRGAVGATGLQCAWQGLQHGQHRTLQYLDTLETRGRYTLMVGPMHCEVGNWGHGVHADVLAAWGEWQLQHQRAVHNVFKGISPWTAHYRAIEVEVPDARDESTALNTGLLQPLGQADVLLIAGEASSHCVCSTTEHIVLHLPRRVPGWQARRIVLLTDGMSPVGGFEAQNQAFLDAMRVAGAQLMNMNEIML